MSFLTIFFITSLENKEESKVDDSATKGDEAVGADSEDEGEAKDEEEGREEGEGEGKEEGEGEGKDKKKKKKKKKKGAEDDLSLIHI